jgi:hypothetical protein
LLFRKAKQNLNVDDDWTLAQTLFGVTTYYRREKDGSLSIKLEGTIHGVPLFDQVPVLREIDLHHKWAPFCSSSLTIAHLDKLDTVGWFVVGLPHFGLMRDGCFRAIGCDSIYEDGSVLLVAQGINDKPENGADRKSLQPIDGLTDDTTVNVSAETDVLNNVDNDDTGNDVDSEEKRILELLSNDPILDGLDIPLPPTRMGSGRMTIKTFQALIHIESPTSATSKIVANVDPNLPLIPQSLLDFLMKRLCGVLMSKLQSAAKKISKDPVTNPHAIKMREEEDFYKGWLMEKFRGVSKLRGWEEPEFAVFELSDAQLDIAEAYSAKKKKKTQKAIKLYHSMTDDNLDAFLESNPKNGLSVTSEPAYVGKSDPASNSSSGPRVRAVSDGDSLSDLSRNSSMSSSFWRGNPIASYLRDIEEKTELRKVKVIEKSRQRAANRLRPKELDDESRSRLDELRNARARRDSQLMEKVPISSGNDDLVNASSAATSRQQSKNPSSSTSWAVFWTKNGPLTRIVVISTLVVSLFYLLYMCTYFEDFAFSQDGSFLLRRGRDVVTVLYLAFAGTVHFFLLYVALMYSFSSLQIGRIAGKQAKQFYSDNVHLVVCATSGSLVVLGFTKATASKSLEWVLWNLVLLWRTVARSLDTHTTELSFKKYIMVPFGIFERVEDNVSACMTWMKTIFVESTVLGRTAKHILSLLWAVPMKIVTGWNSFLADVVDHYEGNTPSESWRENAFVASRAFLAYSATFLLVLLFLFNTSARHARLPEYRELEEDNDNATTASPIELESSPPKADGNQSGVDGVVASSKGDGRVSSRSRIKFNRSLSPDFDTIHEEGIHDDDVASRNASAVSQSSSTSRGRFPKLRFRHNRTKSSEM